MGYVWLIGSICTLIFACFYAGLNSDELFYQNKCRSVREGIEREFDGDRVMGYACISLLIALSWPLSITATILFLCGYKIANRKGVTK